MSEEKRVGQVESLAGFREREAARGSISATLDVSEAGHEYLEIEFGGLRDEFLMLLEGAEITMSYKQIEKLYHLLKPYFEVDED